MRTMKFRSTPLRKETGDPSLRRRLNVTAYLGTYTTHALKAAVGSTPLRKETV